MAIIFIVQIFVVKEKLLTIIVDIVAVIVSVLELVVDVKSVPNEYDSLTNKGTRTRINLLPFMIQQASLLFVNMIFSIEEILKLGLDSKD